MKFAGALGHIFNVFGGKAAKEGVVTKVALTGDRMLTSWGDTGQIIDLAEEKGYDVHFDNSSYRVTTFEELRRRMREAEEKARQECRVMSPRRRLRSRPGSRRRSRR